MRGPWRRYFVAYYTARPVSHELARPGPSLFPELEVDRTLNELDKNGYSVAFRLSTEQIAEMLSFYEAENSNNIHHPHKKCEVFDKVFRDPNVVAIAREYLGREPQLYRSRLYFRFPKSSFKSQNSLQARNKKRNVHFDVTDFRDVALFIYLSDVDEDSSPHVVVEGTHKHKTFWDLLTRRYSREQAEKRFGSQFVELKGPIGTAFFEDTSVFHIQSQGNAGRLMVAAEYTLQRSPELARYQ